MVHLGSYRPRGGRSQEHCQKVARNVHYPFKDGFAGRFVQVQAEPLSMSQANARSHDYYFGLVGAVTGVVGSLLGGASLFQSCRTDQRQEVQQASALLNEARDLLGGFEGATAILALPATSPHQLASLEKARRKIKESVDLAGETAESQILHGAYFIRLGRCRDALTPFRTALDSSPESSEASVGLGAALYCSGETEAARKEWLRALRLNESNPRALYNLAVEASNDVRFLEARDLVERAVQLDSLDYDARELYGTVLLMLGDYTKAGEQLAVAVRLAPANVRLLLKAAQVSFLLARPAAALRYLESAAQLDTTSAVIHERMGNAYRALGEIASSRESFMVAQELRAREM